MLTILKLNEYEKFGGDRDALARMRSSTKATTLQEWNLIGALIQDIKLVKRGLASEEYSESINSSLLQYCDCEETIVEIKRLAELL